MENPLTLKRIHYLDAARAFAAIFVIVLHCAAGYLTFPVPEWPRYNNQCSLVFDYLVGALHIFCMPTFYFIAGVFSIRLIKKLGFFGFIKDRCMRIVLPFLCVTLFLHLPVLLNAILRHEIHSLRDFFLQLENISYLWFLENLIIFYLGFLLIAIGFKYMKASISRVVDHWIQSKWRWFYIVCLNFIFLYFYGAWFTPIHIQLIPSIWLLGIYGIYFILGIVLAEKGAIEIFFFRRDLVIGVLSYIIYLLIMSQLPRFETTRIVAISFYSIASYFLLSGFLYLCIKYGSKKNYLLQFIANASYWMYFSQIFVILLIHEVVAKRIESIYIQFIIVFFTTLISLLVAYRFFPGRKRVVVASSELSLSR